MIVTIIVSAGVSLAITLWSLFILSQGAPTDRTYVALFTALCTISCAACLSSLPLAAYTVVGIGTVPVSVSLLLTEDFALMSRGANLLMVAPLVVGMIYRQHRQLCRLVASRGEIAAEQVKVRELAYRDPLTGLANRRAFLDELRAASTGTRRARLAVGIIDLDGFKIINDTYGHQTGDALLVETARRCRSIQIGDAVIARFGGDEFAVLLHDAASLEDARSRLTDLASAFDESFVVGSQTFRMTASIGVAHNRGAETTMDLVNRADLAMYEAKRSPVATICLFEQNMEAQARRRIMIQQALASHPDNERIELHYQPVVDANTGRIVAFEALARWDHPTIGTISPTEFIPIAEQAGMTEAMTTYLFSAALRAASSWPDEITLSFNISAAELASPKLATRLLGIVAEYEFNPQRLSIEVTETALLRDFALARTTLDTLRHGGVRILLDDFGAGYASIGYLREIRFDGIKLDGSLITSLMDSESAHALLTGVLELCRAIGAPVTAEMVETEAQHDLLQALGVQRVQGYFLSKPLSADQALEACGEFQSATKNHVVRGPSEPADPVLLAPSGRRAGRVRSTSTSAFRTEYSNAGPKRN